MNRFMKIIAVTIVLLVFVQAVSPNISATFHVGHSVVYAADGDSAPAPWWWSVVVFVVGNCITNYDSGSWYDRQVCQRAVRFIRWLVRNSDDILCSEEWIDVAKSPLDDDARIALHSCLLRNGLPMLN